ncbi:hypothetical protein [Methylobacterium sp. WL7]|uniref:hypothetical protein n=1 Tax=Methylobacterium sp. WL7 TaxID=2603900 RepID=UPI0011C71D24|nr:hypothetical protein [Methylobacterium sp. WL7]TXN42379.1 hypothetical protein FV233_23115 [Methylobacterium sp. WL7]
MEAAMAAGAPSVGIFWGVPDPDGSIILVVDRTPLAEAEPYGTFLTHPRGHYEVWETWRRLTPAGRTSRELPGAIVWHEYEECPRGRIVYSRTTETFIVYADRRLQGPALVSQIVQAFGLITQRYSVQSDSHYR